MTSPPASSPSLPPSSRRAFWALIGAIAFAVGVAVVPRLLDPQANIIATEWFPGTDTYMRMVRVENWLAGGGWANWYETFSARSNWPYGETLHWTRPMDVALALLAAPFWPFLGLHKALYIAAVVVGPVLLVAAIGLLLWGTRPLLDARGRVIFVVLFALQPMVQSTFAAARPDHHSMILLAFAGTFAALIRLSCDPAHNARAAGWAGAWAAFGIWVSVEALAVELFALLALGLVWVVSGRAAWLAALTRFTLTGALVIAVALALERPPGEWLTSEEYDRLSTVQAVLLALIALGVHVMHRVTDRLRQRGDDGSFARLVTGLFGAGAAAMVMAGLYPAFFKGPFGAAMDARLANLWLDQINEFTPLLRAEPDAAVLALIVLAPALWTIVWGLRALKDRRYGEHTGAVVLTIALAVFLFVPLASYQARWGGYVGMAVALPWAIVLVDVLDWSGGPKAGRDRTPVLRTPLFAGVALAHLLAAWAVGAATGITDEAEAQAGLQAAVQAKTPCKWRDLAPVLNGPAFTDGGPKVLFTFMHMGPEVLYRTPHRVVGTPYHRNTDGLLDSFTVFTGHDLNEARAVLTRRGADYLIACTGSGEENFLLDFEGDTLMRRIDEGRAPRWLAPVALPEDLHDAFRVYRVVPPTP